MAVINNSESFITVGGEKITDFEIKSVEPYGVNTGGDYYEDKVEKKDYVGEFISQQLKEDVEFIGKFFPQFTNNIIHNDGNPIIVDVKIGRNSLCPCGSGKKYKKCCIDKEENNE